MNNERWVYGELSGQVFDPVSLDVIADIRPDGEADDEDGGRRAEIGKRIAAVPVYERALFAVLGGHDNPACMREVLEMVREALRTGGAK